MIMDKDRIMRVFYNMVSPVYDFFFGSRTPRVKQMRKHLVERLGLKYGDTVLEVSIGTGANLPFISKKIGPEGKIYGIDISEGMLKRCRMNAFKEKIMVELKLGNASRLPYKDNMFDAVLSFGGINFFSKKKKAIDEMVRVAKPGAKMVLGDEVFPLLKASEPPTKLLPKNVTGIKLGYEKVLAKFWVLEFRKK